MPARMWPAIAFTLAATLTEFCGVLGSALGGPRRYEGPMGKSDRALVIGIPTRKALRPERSSGGLRCSGQSRVWPRSRVGTAWRGAARAGRGHLIVILPLADSPVLRMALVTVALLDPRHGDRRRAAANATGL